MQLKLHYLVFGLVVLFGTLLAPSQHISAYQATDRPSASSAIAPNVLGATGVLHASAIPAPGNLVTSTILLPLLFGRVVPTPGYWLSDDFAHELYVTPDSSYVRNHTVYILVSGCGYYVVTHLVSEPISSNHYSFTGTFYGSGTFTSATTATITDGLLNYSISGCGTVSGGPWTANMNWTDSSQPTLAAHAIGPAIDSIMPADHGIEVIKVR